MFSSFNCNFLPCDAKTVKSHAVSKVTHTAGPCSSFSRVKGLGVLLLTPIGWVLLHRRQPPWASGFPDSSPVLIYTYGWRVKCESKMSYCESKMSCRISLSGVRAANHYATVSPVSLLGEAVFPPSSSSFICWRLFPTQCWSISEHLYVDGSAAVVWSLA